MYWARKAEDLAREAHAGLVDKQGRDYYLYHLKPIAQLLRPFGDLVVAAGWLHDIVEDTDMTLQRLRDLRYPDVIVQAVDSVTRRYREPYEDMIRRAAADRVGRLVKLADNYWNLTGLEPLMVTHPADYTRMSRKYKMARVELERSVWVA